MTDYAMVVCPLPEEEGGGYLAFYPDLPGCSGDSETQEGALLDAQQALMAWLDVQVERGVHVPQPGEAEAEARSTFEAMSETIARQTEEIAALKAALSGRSKEPAKSRWREVGLPQRSSLEAHMSGLLLGRQVA